LIPPGSACNANGQPVFDAFAAVGLKRSTIFGAELIGVN
jgi:hypothetical protein